MDHPEGAGFDRADRVDFDPRVRLEFRGTQLSSDGGLQCVSSILHLSEHVLYLVALFVE